MRTQFAGGEKAPVSTPRKPPVADSPGAMLRFQFAGPRMKCVPDWVKLLFQVCEIPSPGGKSNSIRQSVSGAVLMFVTVNRAMNPVCQACCTDNVAAAAAA